LTRMNALCLCPDGIIPPVGTSPRQDPRPIRAETRVKLVAAIATGRQWLDQLVTGTIQNFEQIADARSAVFGRSIELLRSLFLRQASFRQPSRDDHPEVSGSQCCATCRLNGQGNTSGSGWHDQNPIFDSVRARTRIFAAGDRLPVFASPVGWRRKLDIVGPIKPRVRGLLPQSLWYWRFGGVRGGGRSRSRTRLSIQIPC
jgi:hypothetical protein